VLKLTPSEAQKLGADLMGEATVYAQLRGDRDVQDQVSRLERQAVDTKRRMDALMAELVRLRQQPELAFE
jgi:polyhydroxyalkanoate synthesis regulator phasin